MITKRSGLFLWLDSVHKATLFSALSLILIGLVLSFSISWAASEKIGLKGTSFFAKHIFFASICLVTIALLSFQTLEKLRIFCFAGFFFVLCCLGFALFGQEIKGAKRWIYVFGFSLQPSEFLKPFYIYVFSFLFTLLEKAKIRQEDSKKIIYFIFFLHIFVIFLLFLQPDFGMIITFNILFLALFYLNVKSLKNLALGGSLLLCAAIFLGSFLDHVRYRIKTFISGSEGYQLRLSEEAIQSGGFFGKGFAESSLKFVLPEAHNDFIFAILLEEFGFIFAVILGIIFLILIFSNFASLFVMKEKISNMFARIYYPKSGGMNEEEIESFIKKSQKSKEGGKYLSVYQDFLFCRNFIFLTCLLIFFEFFINASVSLNLAPTKGIAMPFISYGGSSLIAHGILVGLLLSINKKRYFFLM